MVFVGVHILVPMAAPVWGQYWRSTTDHRAKNLLQSPKQGEAVRSDQFCRCWYIHEQA